MAIEDWELWACAHSLVGKHGEDAGIHAAMRADQLHGEGDLEGAAVWRRIVHRINQLQAKPASLQ